jgi:pimeloyl-ACP methyl ester carboxylesterase
MQLVSTRVGEVAVDVRGSGPPLVLLHSIGHDRHDWDAVRTTLAAHHRTVAVDWPGHGDSPMWREPRSASAGALVDALEDVVVALGLERAIFMGNSVGGTASVGLALRRPERVRALVLVDTGGFTGTSALVRAFCWLQGRELVRRFTGLAFARNYLKVRGPAVDGVLERLAEARTRPGFIEMDAAMWRSFGTGATDFSGKVGGLACPTLVVWGKHDPVLRARVEGHRVRSELPHAAWVELDTGHAPFVERPNAFLAEVVPFLGGLPAEAR